MYAIYCNSCKQFINKAELLPPFRDYLDSVSLSKHRSEHTKYTVPCPRCTSSARAFFIKQQASLVDWDEVKHRRFFVKVKTAISGAQALYLKDNTLMLLYRNNAKKALEGIKRNT